MGLLGARVVGSPGALASPNGITAGPLAAPWAGRAALAPTSEARINRTPAMTRLCTTVKYARYARRRRPWAVADRPIIGSPRRRPGQWRDNQPMAGPRSGLTFVFTDIEGSTQLL